MRTNAVLLFQFQKIMLKKKGLSGRNSKTIPNEPLCLAADDCVLHIKYVQMACSVHHSCH